MATRKWLRCSLCVVLMIGAGTTLADTLLGEWVKTVNANGTVKKPRHLKPADVYQDANGKIYLKFRGSSDGTLYPGAGSKTHVSGGAAPHEQAAFVPGSDGDQFAQGVAGLIETQLAALTPLTPGPDTLVYPLELTTELKGLGDAALLWGDTGNSTDGVLGFKTADMPPGYMVSVLASSTSDGTSPVRYDFDPAAANCLMELMGLDGDFQAQMVATDPVNLDVSNVVTAFEVTGIPEPATLLALLLAATLSRRR